MFDLVIHVWSIYHYLNLILFNPYQIALVLCRYLSPVTTWTRLTQEGAESICLANLWCPLGWSLFGTRTKIYYYDRWSDKDNFSTCNDRTIFSLVINNSKDPSTYLSTSMTKPTKHQVCQTAYPLIGRSTICMSLTPFQCQNLWIAAVLTPCGSTWSSFGTGCGRLALGPGSEAAALWAP